jgi:hypothetical protein
MDGGVLDEASIQITHGTAVSRLTLRQPGDYTGNDKLIATALPE